MFGAHPNLLCVTLAPGTKELNAKLQMGSWTGALWEGYGWHNSKGFFWKNIKASFYQNLEGQGSSLLVNPD